MSATDPQGLQSFPRELEQREAWLEPFDWYAEMRDTNPVRFDRDRNTWDVFRYADVKRVLGDDEAFSVEPETASDFVEPTGLGEGLLFETMLFRDPPRHDELRAVVADDFRPRALRDMEPRIREITRELLDAAMTDREGRLDVVEDLAYPLPVIVIAEMLGVPSDDRARFKAWSDAVVASTSREDADDAVIEKQMASLQEMGMYFLELLEERRENPSDDLISTMVTARSADDAKLSQQEALGTCALLLIAGNITTTNLITNAVRCLGDHQLFDPVAGGELQVSTVLEEVLRYRSPVQAMGRIAAEDLTLQHERISAGDRLIAWLGSANRDERQFENAAEFLPERAPAQHLAFGHGTHYCLGAPLARLEARIALEELLDRCRGIRLVDTRLDPLRSSFIYGVEALPITYQAPM